VRNDIDHHVTELLKLGVPLILDYNEKLNVYILPAYITDGEAEEGVTYPHVQYQVSNGLEGVRSHSYDEQSYKEAQKSFADMCKEKSAEPNCFGKMYAAYAAECNGGKDAVTSKVFDSPCIYAKRCANIVRFHRQQEQQQHLVQLRKRA
jgi:hypothetical protein